ncbi:MAG: hemolysin family protein [Desulfuromonadaceae bacterium]|nr:hemolysin family protein [Desulfuromonadaceae bacterium]MDD2849919.1 hemolysin family protein [Desulfuromonadaceae bacterium]MDD4131722.1 hemolysin family protein [Desulfuromonadaceae bacterium]
MGSIIGEFILILILILANGFFSGSELAILSARKSTISRLASEGNSKAQMVEKLQNDPHRFLATVQIGVTVVGSLASAVGGVVAIEYLKPALSSGPFALVHEMAEPLAIALVVILVSYLSLVFGELAPKVIGLRQADRVALLVAGPINAIAVIAGVAVRFLTLSNRAVLAIFGVETAGGQDFITREDVLHAVTKGSETGALSRLEQKVIENMLDFSRTLVCEVMVPRTRIAALNIDTPLATVMQTVRESSYTRFPVYRERQENIIGFMHAKDLILHPLGDASGFNLADIVRPTIFVPENKHASELLGEMQRSRVHMAIVVDEYGEISGLVTAEDLLEELVGEIEDEHDASVASKTIKLPDGSLIVDGIISLHDVEELLDMERGENQPYNTLAGLILDELGRFPKRGERLGWKDYVLVCEEVTRTSVVKVRITRTDNRQQS